MRKAIVFFVVALAACGAGPSAPGSGPGPCQSTFPAWAQPDGGELSTPFCSWGGFVDLDTGVPSTQPMPPERIAENLRARLLVAMDLSDCSGGALAARDCACRLMVRYSAACLGVVDPDGGAQAVQERSVFVCLRRAVQERPACGSLIDASAD